MTDLASKLFAVGQLVGYEGANFKLSGDGGSYNGQAHAAPQEEGSAMGSMGGLLGQAMAGGSKDATPMADGALVSGDINNAKYSNNFGLQGAAEADNTQYGLMGQPQEGLGAGMQYNQQPLPQANPYGLQNTQGLNYQQPSGWSTFFQ